MIGLIKASLAAQGIDAGGYRVSELPAHGRLGGGGRIRDLDEGILGGSGQVAGNHLIGLVVTVRGRSGVGRRRIPAHFIEAGILRRRHDLEGTLALDRHPDTVHAADHVGNGSNRRSGNRLVQCKCHRAQCGTRIGWGWIVDCIDQGPHDSGYPAGFQFGGVHHQIIPGCRLKIGRASEGNLSLGAGSIGSDVSDPAYNHAIGDTRISHGGSRARTAIVRSHELGRVDRHRIGHGERNFLDEGFLKKPGLGGSGIRLLALFDDLRRHHDDRRDRRHHEAGDRQRGQDFDQGEGPPFPKAATLGRGIWDNGDH